MESESEGEREKKDIRTSEKGVESVIEMEREGRMKEEKIRWFYKGEERV